MSAYVYDVCLSAACNLSPVIRLSKNCSDTLRHGIRQMLRHAFCIRERDISAATLL